MNTDNELELAEFKLKLRKKDYGMQVNMLIMNLCILFLNVSVVVIDTHRHWFDGVSIGALIISFFYILANLSLEYQDVKFYSLKVNNIKWRDKEERERTENLFNLRKQLYPKEFK